uniref:HIT domain-containing protein n=1 Tax=Oryza meridionalis TaxID=40149 RepID=A0A0E0C9D6_9ORYZ
MEAAASQRLGEEVGEGDEPGQCQSTAAAGGGERKRRPPRSSRVSLVPIFSDGRRKGGRTRRRALRRTNHKQPGKKHLKIREDQHKIFDKILRKEIPSQVVYEDEKTLAFRDISPQAPVHIIIIPKVKDGLSRLSKAEERHVEVMGHLLYAAKTIAKQENLDDGFRIVINDGPNGCEHKLDPIETIIHN